MEQETDGSANTSDESKSSAELIFQEYELPDLLEFSALDYILYDKPCEGSDLGFHSLRHQSVSTPTLQQDRRPIFADKPQELDIEEEDPTRFQFVCRVCEKSFKTIRACERHIIRSGHTYPLIALRSSDIMNGLDNYISQDSLEGTYSSSKNVPSPHLLPVYMGKWSKVICELRHRFGQDPDCENGVFLNHNQQNLVERYSQPDVTQTEPKAPHAELARTMEKLNECFQTKSLPAIGTGTSNMNSLSEQPNLVEEIVADAAVEEQPSERQDEIDKLSETFGQLVDVSNTSDLSKEEDDAGTSVPKNASVQKDSDVMLSDQDFVDHPVHKIYVDFHANKLRCEGCGIVLYTLNDAANHWKRAKSGHFRESSEDVVDGAIRRAAGMKAPADFDENNKKKHYEIDTNEECSPNDHIKKLDAGGDEQLQNDGEPNNNGTGQDEAPPQGNEDKPNDIPENCDNSSGKFFGSLKPSGDKQSDGAMHGRSEKEFLLTDGKKRGSVRRSKKKKNKPLKYIRRFIMFTVTLIF